MAHRSKRKHVKHETEHVREEAAYHIEPEPITGEAPALREVPRIVGELAIALARRMMHRMLARPRRMLERAREAWTRRPADARG